MKAEDIRIGMKVKTVHGRVGEVVTLPDIIDNFVSCLVEFKNEYYENDGATIDIRYVHISNLEPIDPPEFEWDTEVPTVGEPVQMCNNWYIQIDNKKQVFFEEPIDIATSSLTRMRLCAIIPNREHPFILTNSSSKMNIYLPVKHNPPKPKVLELTMEEVNEKFGCEVKIVSKEK